MSIPPGSGHWNGKKIEAGPYYIQGKRVKYCDHSQYYTIALVDNPKLTEEAQAQIRTAIASLPVLLETLHEAQRALSIAVGLEGRYCERGGMEVTTAREAWLKVIAAIQAAEAGGV